jgi:2-methylisocitrate lyase-like PEP mutase family enzyme
VTSPPFVAEVPAPVNGNTGKHVDLATLRGVGVARVSVGPPFYRTAMVGLKGTVQEAVA